MKQTQPIGKISGTRSRWIGIGLTVLVGIAAATSLGFLLSSTHWENAVRWIGLGSVLIVIVLSPIDGLFLWLILEPYTPFWYLNIHMPSGIPDLSLSRLSVAFLCVVWMARLAARRRRLWRFGFVEVSMLLLCILMIPAIASSLSGLNRTLQLFLDKFITPFILFVLAKNLYDDRTGLDRLTAALAVIEGYLCFFLFYEHLTGRALFYTVGRTTVYTRSLRKIVSLLGNAAFLATILAMIAPIALYRFVRARTPFSRFLYGGMFALAVIGNFFCYNRGAWLALATGLLILILFEPEYRRLLLPLLIIAACVGLLYWGAISRSAVITERLSNVNSIRFRVNMLEVSQRMIEENLLFGVGFGNFADFYIQYGGHWELMAWDVPTPHNTYVLVLATMGLVTLTPYLMMFLSLFTEMGVMMRRGWRRFGADRALLVSGWSVVAAYMVSAAALDLYASTFTSLVLFSISGTIIGYVSSLRAEHRRQVAASVSAHSVPVGVEGAVS